MRMEEFFDRLNRCMEKALMDDLWFISDDEDEMSDICVNQDRSIRILNTSLDYKTDDVRKIQYEIRSEGNTSKILITFSDHNCVELGIRDGDKYFLIKAGDRMNTTTTQDEAVPIHEGYPCTAFDIEDAGEAWRHMKHYTIVQNFGDTSAMSVTEKNCFAWMKVDVIWPGARNAEGTFWFKSRNSTEKKMIITRITFR